VLGNGVFSVVADVGNGDSSLRAGVKIYMVASGRASGNKARARMRFQKRGVNPLADKHRDHLGVLWDCIETFDEGDLVTGKRLFKETPAFLFDFDK
jgi:hypothetical protein